MGEINVVSETLLQEILAKLGNPLSSADNLNGILNDILGIVSNGFESYYPSPIAIQASQMRKTSETSAKGITLNATGKGILFMEGGSYVSSSSNKMHISQLNIDGKSFVEGNYLYLPAGQNFYVEFQNSVSIEARGKGYATIILF